jgi:hypothetical protein
MGDKSPKNVGKQKKQQANQKVKKQPAGAAKKD